MDETTPEFRDFCQVTLDSFLKAAEWDKWTLVKESVFLLFAVFVVFIIIRMEFLYVKQTYQPADLVQQRLRL